MKNKPTELIQNKDWWKTHSNGIGWYATVKAEHKLSKEKRFFISDTKTIENFLNKNWKVYAI